MKPTDIDALLVCADADAPTAAALHARLAAAGITPWCAARDLVPGDTWDRAIPDAIARARLLVVLVGPSWPAPGEGDGDWYAHEQVALAIDHARDRDPPTRVAPIWLDGVPRRRLPYGLRRLVAIEAAASDLDAMADGIQRALAAMTGQTPPPRRRDPIALDPIALRGRLAELFPSRDAAAMLLDDAGFTVTRFDLGGAPINRWYKALAEVRKHPDGLERLIAAAKRHGYTL